MIKSFYLAIKENKNYIILVSILFILGVIMSSPNSDLVKDTLEGLDEVAQTIQEQDSVFYMIKTIFTNNFLIALSMILLGILLGIYPMAVVFINGIIIGAVIKIIYAKVQSIPYLVFGLLPHGIFEISAIIIAASFGVKLGFSAVKAIVEKFKQQEDKKSKAELINTIKQTPSILLGVLVILLVAAIIESTVTIYLLNIIS